MIIKNIAGERFFVAPGSSLEGLDLRGADLTEADLSESHLTKADLTDADLTDADLTDADLTGVDLTKANLRIANLARANLKGANLTGANLARVNLTGAIMPDGRTWEAYRADPLAGICEEPEARARALSAWGNHTWQDCPMHTAYGWESVEDAPETKRFLVGAFIALFDSKLLKGAK